MEDGIMKKSLFFAAALLALVACTREMNVDTPAGKMTITARTETSADTRTVVEGETHVYWEPGDEIKVFVDGKSGKFTTDITASSASATFKGTLGDDAWTEGMELWAVYPYSKDAVFSGGTITTTLPSEQVARFGSFGKGMNLSVAHSSGDRLQFYNVGGGIRFRLTQEGIKKVTFEGYGGEFLSGTVKIGFDENGKPVVREVADGSRVITLLPPSGNDSFPTNVWFYCVAIPGSLASGYKLEFYRESEYSRMASDKAVTIKRSIFGSIDNADEGCEFIPIPNTIATPDAIDLGLPSGLKWASFNLGASKPEEFGDYYAWGETEPHYVSQDPLIWKSGYEEDGYEMRTYQWFVQEVVLTAYTPLVKYNTNPDMGYLGFVDNKTVLDPEDDAAHVNLGGKWRMPTYAEWEELLKYCSVVYTKENGVFGHRLTSYVTGHSIFLPLAGYYDGTSLLPEGDYKKGSYWSSSLMVDLGLTDKALSLLTVNGNDFLSCNSDFRFLGQTIRPVYGDAAPEPHQAPVPEAVDLGLSVNWASFNLGASKPEEYGNYYAWGETEFKNLYNGETYKLGDLVSGQLTKYNVSDGRTVLEPEDDAAHVMLGGKWRMPTKEEMEELMNKCHIEKSSRNGIPGVQCVNSETGASIFLPAAGLKEVLSPRFPGKRVMYMSSTVSNENPAKAKGLYIEIPSGDGDIDWILEDFYRIYGSAVRAVRDK